MHIVIGSDKDGMQLKEVIKKDLTEKGFMIIDKNEIPSEDFVAFALAAANDLMNNEGSLDITVGSYGVGSFILTTKVKGTTVAVVSDGCSAYMAREHNNSRMIAPGPKIVGEELALSTVKEFSQVTHAGGRHQVRVDMLNEIAQKRRKYKNHNWL